MKYIYLKDSVESKLVQKMLFDKGYEWLTGKSLLNIDFPHFIKLNEDNKKISYGAGCPLSQTYATIDDFVKKLGYKVTDVDYITYPHVKEVAKRMNLSCKKVGNIVYIGKINKRSLVSLDVNKFLNKFDNHYLFNSKGFYINSEYSVKALKDLGLEFDNARGSIINGKLVSEDDVVGNNFEHLMVRNLSLISDFENMSFINCDYSGGNLFINVSKEGVKYSNFADYNVISNSKCLRYYGIDLPEKVYFEYEGVIHLGVKIGDKIKTEELNLTIHDVRICDNKIPYSENFLYNNVLYNKHEVLMCDDYFRIGDDLVYYGDLAIELEQEYLISDNHKDYYYKLIDGTERYYSMITKKIVDSIDSDVVPLSKYVGWMTNKYGEKIFAKNDVYFGLNLSMCSIRDIKPTFTNIDFSEMFIGEYEYMLYKDGIEEVYNPHKIIMDRLENSLTLSSLDNSKTQLCLKMFNLKVENNNKKVRISGRIFQKDFNFEAFITRDKNLAKCY